jgi:alpha-tubulin suppressor-like RCC1 family protein
VRTGGTLWAWGDNAQGQLGDGTTTEKWSPTEIIGPDVNWVTSVAAGGAHTVVTRTTTSADRTLWTWGWNWYGQLGDGTNTSRSSPAQVGSDTSWIYVASGEGHALAIKADGTLWAWGRNHRGQLGDGTTVNRDIPTRIP